MFIIYGSRNFQKVLLTSGITQCGHCGNDINYNLTKVTTWATLFWIPIFPFSFKYYWLCPLCKYGYKITKKEAMDIVESSRASAENIIDVEGTEIESPE